MTDSLYSLLGEKWFSALWVSILLIVFFVYPAYEAIIIGFHLRRIGRKFCAAHGYTYVGVAHAKSHFSIVYKPHDCNMPKYAKLILHTSFGRLRKVQWL